MFHFQHVFLHFYATVEFTVMRTFNYTLSNFISKPLPKSSSELEPFSTRFLDQKFQLDSNYLQNRTGHVVSITFSLFFSSTSEATLCLVLDEVKYYSFLNNCCIFFEGCGQCLQWLSASNRPLSMGVPYKLLLLNTSQEKVAR